MLFADCDPFRPYITHTIDVLIVGTLRRAGGREQCEWWYVAGHWT